jgi:hypothetical protein
MSSYRLKRCIFADKYKIISLQQFRSLIMFFMVLIRIIMINCGFVMYVVSLINLNALKGPFVFSQLREYML